MTTEGKIIAGGLLLVMVLGALYLWSNRGYGDTSETGYQFATALFSACNRRDSGKIQQLSEQLEAAVANQEIQAKEARWLRNIIEDGQQGRWPAANQAVRQLMLDQLKAAPPLPAPDS